MKTSELIGAQLDWAVAKCGGIIDDPAMKVFIMGGDISIASPDGDREYYRPSENWAQGGPIIEREGITVKHVLPTMTDSRWQASMYQKAGRNEGIANTPLIAAMRCYVASKLGDEVEIPEELK